MDFNSYLADRSAVSKHWLDLIERSPAHLRYHLDNPEARKETPALRFGRIFHTALLEPDIFYDQYVVLPTDLKKPTISQINAKKPAPKTIEQIKRWNDWQSEHGEKENLAQDEIDQVFGMSKAVKDHTKAAALLGIGAPEVTTFWPEPETGEQCKARADWLHGKQASVIVDLKTCEDARPKAFIRSIINYRYDVQAAHYSEGFSQVRFVFIAVEKAPPYGVAVYAVDGDILQRGQNARLNNLETYSECKAKDSWPGYIDEIQTIELPAWAKEAA